MTSKLTANPQCVKKSWVGLLIRNWFTKNENWRFWILWLNVKVKNSLLRIRFLTLKVFLMWQKFWVCNFSIFRQESNFSSNQNGFFVFFFFASFFFYRHFEFAFFNVKQMTNRQFSKSRWEKINPTSFKMQKKYFSLILNRRICRDSW